MSLLRQSIAPSVMAICMCFASAAHATDKINFQLDWLAGGDKAPVYVGIAKGFFAKQDLDVSVTPGSGSNDALTRIASGRADIGLTDITALMVARARADLPVKAFLSVFTQAPHAFYVREDSPVKNINDLTGKKLATATNTSSNYFLPLVLTKNGIDPSSIHLVNTDPNAQAGLLITKQVDGVITWVTDYATYEQAAKEAGTGVRMMPWYNYGLETYATSVIANQAYLDAHPDVIKRFSTAYLQSIEYTFAHPHEAAEAVHSIVPEVDEATAEETINRIRPLVYNDISQRDGLGKFTPAYLKSTWQLTAKSQGIEEESYDPLSTVDSRYLTKSAEAPATK